MRLRRVAPPTTWPTPPPELAGDCYVEDWTDAVDVDELAREVVDEHNPRLGPREAHERLAVRLMIRARRRFQTARRAWLDEHEVPHGREDEAIRAAGMPRFRGEPPRIPDHLLAPVRRRS